MTRGRRVALGVATALLVACYAALAVALTLPWTYTEPDGSTSVGGLGALVGYGSLFLGMALGGALLLVYLVVVFSRRDWSLRRRSLWAVLLWLGGPIAMPTYYLRHVRPHGG